MALLLPTAVRCRATSSSKPMRGPLIVCGQWLAFGLGRPDQHDQAQQVNARQHHRYGSKGLGKPQTFEGIADGVLENDDQCRQYATDVVAEPGSAGTEPRGIQFGKVNRVSSEDAQRGESQQGQHHVGMPGLAEKEKHGRDDDPAEKECHAKSQLAAHPRRDPRERQHSQ